jgi:hypothetical protein
VKILPAKSVLFGAVCGLVGVVSLADAEERVRIFVQPDEFLGTIAAALSADAPALYRFDVVSAASDRDVVERVADDPRAIGVVQHDTYLADVRRHGVGNAHLELYGDVPACLVIVAAKGSWIKGYTDLVASSRGPAASMDVGPDGGRIATLVEALQMIDPTLAKLHLEHRGGARALSRVVSGELDSAMLLLQPPFADAALDRLVADGQVGLVPFDMPPIVAGAFEGSSPYRARDIRVGDEGWLASGSDYRGVCTSVGVIVNSAADARLSETVAATMLSGRFAAPEHGWLAVAGDIITASIAAVDRAFGWAGEVVVALLGLGSGGDTAIAGARSGTPSVIPVSHRSDDATGGWR